jgi:hypothetical protein
MMGNSRSRFNRPEYRMTEEPRKTDAIAETGEPQKPLTPAAMRALAEAEARRKLYREAEAVMPKEIGGRGGKEPGRYGDWEVKGLTSDF